MCILVQAIGLDVSFGIAFVAARRGGRHGPTGWRGVVWCIVWRHSVWCCDMWFYVVFACRNVALKLGFSNPNFIFCAFWRGSSGKFCFLVAGSCSPCRMSSRTVELAEVWWSWWGFGVGVESLGGRGIWWNGVVSAWWVGFCAQKSGPDRWRRCCRVQEGVPCSHIRSGAGVEVSYWIFSQ
jgi:hypothetical protein